MATERAVVWLSKGLRVPCAGHKQTGQDQDDADDDDDVEVSKSDLMLLYFFEHNCLFILSLLI